MLLDLVVVTSIYCNKTPLSLMYRCSLIVQLTLLVATLISTADFSVQPKVLDLGPASFLGTQSSCREVQKKLDDKVMEWLYK